MEFPMYPTIDIHSHFDHNVEGEIHSILSDCSLDALTDEAKRFGIKATAYSTYSSVLGAGGNIVSENDYLFNIAQKREEIFQWVVIHPDIKETFSQAERMLENKKVIGIKIHPAMHKYNIEDRGDSIFSFADSLGATVLIHPSKIAVEAPFADKYPNMSLILAHLGSLNHIEAIKNSKNGNIFTDTSGYLSGLNRIIEYAVEQIGSERILFGSDTYSYAFQYSRIAFADISEKHKKNIFYKNALRLFPKLKI